MIDRNDLFAFCFSVFIALTFTCAGVYLTDELSPANQLHQITEGHQLTYHEDKYGFYPDGSVDRSITGANYVMTYSLLSPILSLPVYTILSIIPDAAGLLPLIFWIICFMILLTYIVENKKIYIAICALVLIVNIILYKSFDMSNIEILSIVLTNTILYGLFGMMVWKVINRVIGKDEPLVFTWIAVMSCSSLLFWVGNLKDHVVVALLAMVLLYMFIRFNTTGAIKFLIAISFTSGLLIWERPELSVVIIPSICLYLIYRYGKSCIYPLTTFFLSIGFALLPAFLNNYIVTGSPTKFPFQAVNQTLGGAHFLSSQNMYDVLFHEFPAYIMANLSVITPENIIGILIFPLNGGIGILPILLLPIFILLFVPYFKKYKNFSMNDNEKILLFFSFAIAGTYLFTSYLGFRLHMESGILPDMRYFTIIYAPLTIASMSILSRVYDFNYKLLIKRYILSLTIMMMIFTGLLMFIFNHSYIIYTSDIDIVANILCIFLFGLSLATIVDAIRNNNTKGLSYMIPILISLPAMWQFFSAALIQKIYVSPMFIPVIQFLKSIIFG